MPHTGLFNVVPNDRDIDFSPLDGLALIGSDASFMSAPLVSIYFTRERRVDGLLVTMQRREKLGGTRTW